MTWGQGHGRISLENGRDNGRESVNVEGAVVSTELPFTPVD